MKRRDFLSLSGVGLASLGASRLRGSEAEINKSVSTEKGKKTNGSDPLNISNQVIREPVRDLPVVSSADVVVCGGGPAGVCAAIASARMGADTLLIESQGCLGGIWTASLLGYILDMGGKKGILKEIAAAILKRNEAALRFREGESMTFDPEILKLVLEGICLKAGVRIRYFTRIAAAVKQGRRVHAAVLESKSGREAVLGKVFIDCTGDGDFAYQAGCGFDWGNPVDGSFQPMSFNVMVTGINYEEAKPYIIASRNSSPNKKALLKEMKKAGFTPSYAGPSIFLIRKDLYVMMSNHEYRLKGISAEDLTRATIEGRAEMFAQIDALRKYGGIWKNMRIVATPDQLGVREGRRVHGLYTVSAEDLRLGRSQPDAVCKVRFPIDVHSTNPDKTKGIEGKSFRAKPYDIPLRALIAKDVDGLLMAGRCISGDFIAHSSYRVTGNAAPMGEAAGQIAAKAALVNKLPSELVKTNL